MAVQAHATAKYIRTSAQKAGLVLNLIRGRDVNQALATLRFARKGVARDIEKVLRSAIANASQKDGFGGDVERLFVNACYANQGPSQKRIRPAPMGRAFRVREADGASHGAGGRATAARGGRAGDGGTAAGEGAPKRPRGAKPKPKAAPKARGKADVGQGRRQRRRRRRRRAAARRKPRKPDELTANGDLWVRKYIRTDSGSASTRRGARDGSPTRTTRSCCTRT